MAYPTYLNRSHFDVPTLHTLTGVSHYPTELDGNGDPKKDAGKSQLLFQDVATGSSFGLPVVASSLNILREQATKTIKDLEGKLALKSATVDDYIKRIEAGATEIKLLVSVCRYHYDRMNKALASRDDAERKWVATVKELDEHKKANKALTAQLNSNQSRLQTKFEQATKQAKEWKDTATTRAKEIERLANLVIERTNERDALKGIKDRIDPFNTYQTITFGDVKGFRVSASHSLKTISAGTATFKYDQGYGLPTTIAGPTLTDCVSTLEAKVEKLEKPAESEPKWRILGKEELVKQGDEFQVTETGNWLYSANWQNWPHKQEPGYRYRRKV